MAAMGSRMQTAPHSCKPGEEGLWGLSHSREALGQHPWDPTLGMAALARTASSQVGCLGSGSFSSEWAGVRGK